MKIRIFQLLAVTTVFLFFGCIPAYRVPYLSLDLKELYTVSDISFNYTYVCEEDSQRCVYKLYNKAEPSVEVYSSDAILEHFGTISFNGLAEGDYLFEFSVYSSKDGSSSLLKFLDEGYDFSIDLP